MTAVDSELAVRNALKSNREGADSGSTFKSSFSGNFTVVLAV